jgi:hypothetical protein
MHRFILAIRAFIKALKAPQEAAQFLDAPVATKHEQPRVEGDYSHLRLLGLLQQSGRLVDFFQEDISSFDDAQIGSVVRNIHADCRNTIEELITIRPIMDQTEGTAITIPAGYDAAQIKVVGKVTGTPPFTGTIVHRGWKAHKKSLPKTTGEQFHEIIATAEIEVR